MCGIAGYFNIDHAPEEGMVLLERMIWQLRHRGPDGFGFFQDKRVGLAHARLSIIDLEGGWQPIANEDTSLWIIFNGEIFNYPELRQQLIARGHRFRTESDTEVILHLYEEKGVDCLQELNGQFALAIYDQHRGELFLARDRMGIRPLFYTFYQNRCYFGSEIKALFAADRSLPRALNRDVIGEIFTVWSPVGRETAFQDIEQLEPGHWLKITRDGKMSREQYWQIPHGRVAWSDQSEAELAKELHELLIDATRLRLRADVPVGAYLSGGLDSSTITSLIRNYTDNKLKTFSVTFTDKVYDEAVQQQVMAKYLTTEHHAITCSYGDIATAFTEVIWHTETPLLRTAPTPLFLLSSLVREHDYKVILTGEGADEILGGYDIFKEAKIRAFIGSRPDSSCRPFLLRRLYPYLALSPAKSAEYARRFFDTDADIDDIFYGHRPRWKTTMGTHRFLDRDLAETVEPAVMNKLRTIWEEPLQNLDFFSRAQFVESRLLLGNYLLSSQGDRMAMAHSIEGRYPFLDHRVVEFSCTIPPRLRMKALNEKNILKKAMSHLLPDEIVRRKKQPYMAPDILSFVGDREPEYLDMYLSEKKLRESGLFRPKAVAGLLAKCRKKARQGFRENMAFVGILSTQILYDRFIENFSDTQIDDLPPEKVRVMVQ